MISKQSIAIFFATITHLTIIVDSQFDHHRQNANRINCAEIATCNCDYMSGGYELHCPIAAPSIVLRVLSKDLVMMDCNTKDDREYEVLPELNLGNVSMVKLTYCPLPKDKPIMSVLNRLKIKEVTAFFFSSYGGNSVTITRKHLHGLQNLLRLNLNNNGLADLPEDLFDDFVTLKTLELYRNQVKLPINVFTKLTKLEFLELGYNNLHDIEPGLFKNQKNLRRLNLWGNKFKNISKEMFEGLDAVEELDLSECELEFIEEDAFTMMPKLHTINLDGNRFNQLPMDLFVNTPNLSLLKLRNARVPLRSLPNYLFENKTSLGEVFMSGLGLTEIPGGVFYGALNLENLTLANNELKTLPYDIFVELRNLAFVDLSRNKLTELDNIFGQTEKLRILKLNDNQLRNISATLFESLIRLKELHLQNNNLYHFHHNALVTTKTLEVLYMQNNHLSFMNYDADDDGILDFNSPMQNLKELRILNLRNNTISTVFHDWNILLPTLEDLDISYNNISMLTFTDLQFTQENIVVNLTNNKISEIDLLELDLISGAQELSPSAVARIRIYIDNNPIVCNCILIHLVKYFRNEIPQSKLIYDINPGGLSCVAPEKLQGRSVTSLRPEELLCPLDSVNTKYKICPARCDCNVRPFDDSLIVDCSNRNLTTFPTLPSLAKHHLAFTELHIENNNITGLPLADTPGYSDVRKLYANNNYLAYIGEENIPGNITILQVANNNLRYLNVSLINKLNQTKSLEKLSFSANKWKCDCLTLDFLKFIQNQYPKINDYQQIACENGEKISEMTPVDFCPEDHQAVIFASIGFAVLGLLIGLVAAFYYKFNEEIKVWLFSHNMCLWFVTEEELDRDKKYDAFISYSHKDEEFITEHLVPNLEKGPNPFKLCLHIRDWIVGEWIPTQIAKSVEESRRTIVVLSPNFLESVWGRMEFRTAHSNALTEGRARVIVIIYGEIGDAKNLDGELKAYLNMNTYVKWGDPLFWEKLRYAMPHPPGIKKSSKGLVKNGIKSSVDDKLELIIPPPITPQLTTPPADMLQTTNPLNSSTKSHNGSIANGINGHVNGAFIINTNAKQSDV